MYRDKPWKLWQRTADCGALLAVGTFMLGVYLTSVCYSLLILQLSCVLTGLLGIAAFVVGQYGDRMQRQAEITKSHLLKFKAELAEATNADLCEQVPAHRPGDIT